MTPRQRKLDRLLASVARTPPVALAAAPALPCLTSKHIRRVQTLAPCEVCAGTTQRMWRGHAESGAVLLCEGCKVAAFDESFGTLDAAHLAEPSAVESNRRRH
jgi:hypothetical protein